MEPEAEEEVGETGVEGLAAEGVPLLDEEEGAGEGAEESEEAEASVVDEGAAELPFAVLLLELAPFCEGALAEDWPHPASRAKRAREAINAPAIFRAFPSFMFPLLYGS